MAEVLITLGIIGVVAALTIPNVINKYKATELETRFKKAYTVLSQACNRMVFEEGYVIQKTTTSNNSDAPKIQAMLQKYLAKSTDCTDYKCGAHYFNSRTTFVNFLKKYKTYNKKGDIGAIWWYTDDGFIMTNDGMYIFIDVSETPTFLLTVDINGGQPPNIWGHDLFTFSFNSEGKLTFPPDHLGREGVCDKNSTSMINGYSCVKNALSEKDYFKNLP